MSNSLAAITQARQASARNKLVKLSSAVSNLPPSLPNSFSTFTERALFSALLNRLSTQVLPSEGGDAVWLEILDVFEQVFGSNIINRDKISKGVAGGIEDILSLLWLALSFGGTCMLTLSVKIFYLHNAVVELLAVERIHASELTAAIPSLSTTNSLRIESLSRTIQHRPGFNHSNAPSPELKPKISKLPSTNAPKSTDEVASAPSKAPTPSPSHVPMASTSKISDPSDLNESNISPVSKGKRKATPFIEITHDPRKSHRTDTASSSSEKSLSLPKSPLTTTERDLTTLSQKDLIRAIFPAIPKKVNLSGYPKFPAVELRFSRYQIGHFGDQVISSGIDERTSKLVPWKKHLHLTPGRNILPNYNGDPFVFVSSKERLEAFANGSPWNVFVTDTLGEEFIYSGKYEVAHSGSIGGKGKILDFSEGRRKALKSIFLAHSGNNDGSVSGKWGKKIFKEWGFKKWNVDEALKELESGKASIEFVVARCVGFDEDNYAMWRDRG